MLEVRGLRIPVLPINSVNYRDIYSNIFGKFRIFSRYLGGKGRYLGKISGISGNFTGYLELRLSDFSACELRTDYDLGIQTHSLMNLLSVSSDSEVF